MSTEVDLKQEDRALVFRLGFSGSNLNVTTFLTLKFAPLSETKKEKFSEKRSAKSFLSLARHAMLC